MPVSIVVFGDDHQEYAGNTDEQLGPEAGRSAMGLTFKPYDPTEKGAKEKPQYNFIAGKHRLQIY
jgi:hypothetical protein